MASQPHAMDTAQQDLMALHTRAMAQLEHKLSRIPARVFYSDRKPTITDIYTANADAILVPSIPPNLQLDFYSRFAAADFKAHKAKGNEDINLAIWYWQMDQEHSFSRKHRQIRYNILMACLMCAIPEPERYIDANALEFCTAFVDAWLGTVTGQDDFDVQAKFLSLWTSGPYELIYVRNKKRIVFEKAMKALAQYVPSEMPSEETAFRHALRMVSASDLKKFGPVWGIGHILKKKDRGTEDESPEIRSLSMKLSSVSIGKGSLGPSWDVFEQPLVQALLNEDTVDAEMEESLVETSGTMWLDPDMSVKMLQGACTNDILRKMDWHLE